MTAKFSIQSLESADLQAAMELWNSIVRAGRAFPQDEELDEKSAQNFFAAQTFTGIARCIASGAVAGLYILHPNNVGRCGHICNASYAVADNFRGQHVGEMLVKNCMEQARRAGFRILQFNAVVKSNQPALNLYRKLGFTQLGVIPGGFRNIEGVYEDIIPHYIEL
ncbi:MAG: GNAT family N-acetyltransferase [Lentisphaerae bacterium]|nr:GNAT family N-acetyltransferase [Lentisphaerota bacterium]